MAKNYDNWERLVTAVVRKERDKQIALSRSTDNSTVSSTSSSFDMRHGNKLPMDYSDLTLDHIEWKTMVPPDKQEVVWKSASLRFFLDQSTGKNCFLLGAAKLDISSGDGICWEYKSHPKSRFSEVAEFTQPILIINSRIKMQALSPETLYEAYLVFGFSDKCEKVHKANSIVSIFGVEPDSYFKIQYFTVQLQIKAVNEREDGWMEAQVGCFYVGQGHKGDVSVYFLDTSGSMQTGIIVEGFEFRPLEVKKNRKGRGIFSNFRITS